MRSSGNYVIHTNKCPGAHQSLDNFSYGNLPHSATVQYGRKSLYDVVMSRAVPGSLIKLFQHCAVFVYHIIATILIILEKSDS